MSGIKQRNEPVRVDMPGDLARVKRIGCVSYLNSKPLIDGLDGGDGLDVRFDVPSQLLADLESGEFDLALCPVVDYFRSKVPLKLVPVGGICCDGPTMTVCVFSRVPLEEITEIHADMDSHTSVALVQVVFAKLLGRRPRVVDYDAQCMFGKDDDQQSWPQTVLLIGDKVVTKGPGREQYPYQFDLGEAWRQQTGLPFVFATWMARVGEELGDLPERLKRQREQNEGRLVEIADRYAKQCDWPVETARMYLQERIRYEVGQKQIRAIEKFAQLAAELGVIGEVKELVFE